MRLLFLFMEDKERLDLTILRRVPRRRPCGDKNYTMSQAIRFLFLVSLLIIAGCCKHKTETICNPTTFQVIPFVEKYGYFFCGGNDYEYTYTLRKKIQIDSLADCTFSPPVAFPVDETNMLYIAVGRLSFYRNDTMAETRITKDTCSKKVVYEVNMKQRDTTLAAGGLGAVMSIFCSIENIPADYQVEVKYQYVPK